MDSFKGTKILIVDDDESIRDLYSMLLEGEGYAVEVANDGEEAVRLLGENSISLMIIDIIMPGMSGIETIRAAREHDPEIKIIAISGGGSIMAESCLDMAKQLGAGKTFVKPLERLKLLGAIRDLTAH